MSSIMVSACCVLMFLGLSVWGLTDEQDLVASRILSNYNKNVRPPATVQVQLSFMLLRVRNLDLTTKILSLDTWFMMKWKDERLAWVNTPLENVTDKVSIPASMIWIPDISLYNSVDGYLDFNENIRAVVHSDGKVDFVPPTQLNSACDVDSHYDNGQNVTCSMKFGAWTYDGTEVDVVVADESVEKMVLEPNFSDWLFLGASSQRNEVKYDQFPGIYVNVVFDINLQYQGDN